MTVPIRLSLSALTRARVRNLADLVADFTRCHGHPPGEDSTWEEWCAATPDSGDLLWAVAVALPLAYPARRQALLRVVVEVAYRAAARVQPAAPDPSAAADALFAAADDTADARAAAVIYTCAAGYAAAHAAERGRQAQDLEELLAAGVYARA